MQRKFVALILLVCMVAILAAGCTSSASDRQEVPAPAQVTVAPTTTANPLQWGDFLLEKGSLKFQVNEYGTGHVTGTIKNTGSKQYGYVQVSINLYDKDGALVGSTMTNVNNLEAGGIWKFEAIAIDADKASKCKVKGITGF